MQHHHGSEDLGGTTASSLRRIQSFLGFVGCMLLKSICSFHLGFMCYISMHIDTMVYYIW
ncbi:hypothetical protein L208DRAFT_1469034 [Tricholoma matsutake]|nr:hypothetical protein L208DRAFT_1469034 [Tricholoma matsutake 945]